jgi:uncharacterized membrane protein
MGTIERSVEVDRPAADVWTVLEDVRRIPTYSPSTVAVSDAPERLSAVGQRFRQTVVVLGRHFESDWTVTELQPGRRVALEGTVGVGARYCLVEEVEPRGPDRSRLTVRITFTMPLGLLGRVADAFGAQRRAQREAEEVLANLKAHLEASGAPSPPASGSVSYEGPADDAAARLRRDGRLPS